MTQWQQFVAEQTARPLLAGAEAVDRSTLAAGFVAPLTDYGLMAFSGEDAGKFLHNQLTNDVEHLGTEEARLAGYCSPKGRLLATFLMWRDAQHILLQLPAPIQAAVQKRLQMFVLRAKVKVADASADYALLGIGGRAAEAALANRFASLPTAPYAKVDGDAGSLIRFPDAFGYPRYLWVATPAQAIAAWPALCQSLAPVDAATWRLADILAGVPQVVAATQEQFVPQMVNFELLGGVNFKKGCYPGQEIVARSQYLGKLKRRMILATVPALDIAAGCELFSSAEPDQPCGMVVNAERSSASDSALLAEIKLAALDAGSIHAGTPSGPALIPQALPYALPDPA